MTIYFHGGKAGLNVGDSLVPSPPHVEDGCPICVARGEGRICTVGEFRRWLQQHSSHPKAQLALRQLRDAPDDAPLDPPSAEKAVYITTDLDYALWYGARSRGDLYRVDPVGDCTRTTEDFIPSYTCGEAVIVEVIRRAIRLERTDRRRIEHKWRKAEAKVLRRREAASGY